MDGYDPTSGKRGNNINFESPHHDPPEGANKFIKEFAKGHGYRKVKRNPDFNKVAKFNNFFISAGESGNVKVMNAEMEGYLSGKGLIKKRKWWHFF